MANYPLVFALSLLLNIGITFRSSSYWNQVFGRQPATAISASDDGSTPLLDPSAMDLRHQTLLKKYLVVYLLAALSDWLQGPYVYALYDGYGYSKHEIAVLFVAGFGSSMIFGSFVGGMADWGGRRTFALWFCVIYAASCLTKHFRSFTVLLLGRLLGGVATSLLFSVFDAWLIKSHTDASLAKPYLSKSFAWASYGNSVVAIMAGLLANKVANLGATTTTTSSSSRSSSSSTLHRQLAGVDPTTVNAMHAPFPNSFPNWYMGGFINPFDVSLVALILCGVFCRMWWDENYGDDDKVAAARNKSSASLKDNAGSSSTTDNSHPWYGGLRNALTTTLRSRDILLCGIISSLFEGSMYIFVFMWTPQLKDLGTKTGDEPVQLPFGIIFSTFMVCCMAGSSLFSVLIDKTKGEILAVAVLGAATLAMAVVALAKTDTVCFLAMNLFEICVGMYWPIMGTMKGSIVPEDKRAAIYNLYRIPLNFIVLFSLLTNLTTMQSFTLNAVMLSVATFLQYTLMKQRLSGRGGGEVSTSGSSPKSLTDDEELTHLASNMATTEEGQGEQDTI